MKTIAVKMLHTQAGPSVQYKKGETYNLPELKAVRFVQAKAAIPVDRAAFDKAYPKAETADKKKPSETADKKK